MKRTIKDTSAHATDKFVGARIRMARVMAGMSQEKLADALDLSFQQVQKYEKGGNRVSAGRLQQIAAVLDRPVAWFFDEPKDGSDRTDADVVTRMLSTAQGLELATSYLAIKRRETQHQVVSLVRTMAQVA